MSRAPISDEYVAEIVSAAERINVSTREGWDVLTRIDRAAGYAAEVDRAESIYFARLPLPETGEPSPASPISRSKELRR